MPIGTEWCHDAIKAFNNICRYFYLHFQSHISYNYVLPYDVLINVLLYERLPSYYYISH